MEGGRPVTQSHIPGAQQRGRDELQLRLEAARTAAAERAVAEERARIARELHDVIAHSVSVMTVQAGDSMVDAARAMRRERIGALPVLEGERVVGIITRSDMLDYLVNSRDRAADQAAQARNAYARMEASK